MYLRQRDYDRIIQNAELQQYTNVDPGIQQLAYLTAIAKVKSKLKQKFYVDFEFTDTNVYSYAAIYTGQNRVELDFAAYDPTKTYNIGALASNGTSQYLCKVNATTGAFTSANWYLIGTQHDMWYVQYPYPLFCINKQYAVGTAVFWKGNIYIAQQSSVAFTDDDRQQDVYITPLFRNVFPDDPTNGVKAWGNPIPYNITAVTPNVTLANWTAWATSPQVAGALRTYNNVLYIANINSTNVIPGTSPAAWSPITWVYGDNRDQLCVDIMLKLVVWDMTPRIMVDEGPTRRELDFNSANKMLTALAQGDINEDKLILFETGVGLTTNYGGVTKNTNQW